RHADPRRCDQSHHGRRARRQHSPALYRGVRLRRGARRARGAARRTDLQRAAGYGRAHPHPGVRGHRHRRHRLDPRRAGRRGDHRHRRYAGPRLPQAAARHADLAARGRVGRTRARLDADLPLDGRGARLPSAGTLSGARRLMSSRIIGWTIGILILSALPPVMLALGQPFYIDLARRIMILAVAAVSLNLILGYGGMVSFGHAAYIGIGAYAVGILGFYGIFNGWLHILVAMVLRATKSNEARSRGVGFSPYPYRLVAFVIAGAMCGLAGALYGNHTNYITPGLMSWQQSGDIMFMVILGGMASTAGPVLGAFALLLFEDFLSGWTQHWQVILGPLLILSVIFFRRGLAGVFYKPDA